MAIKHFKNLLEGQQFHVYTDHKPLTFAIASNNDKHTKRQVRQLSFIAEYTTELRHISGKNNVVADTLSRICAMELNDYAILAAEQQFDKEVKEYRNGKTNLTLSDISINEGQTTLLCDTSTGRNRPIVPLNSRRRIFDMIHGLCHPGTRAKRKLIASRFVWPGLNKDVGIWTKSCVHCQRAKIHRHTISPLQPFKAPDSRFASIHVDIVGPLVQCQGSIAMFTIIDRFTRWTEVVPIPNMTTVTCAKALFTHWIARFGVPLEITSDRGRQFISEIWTELCNKLGMVHHRTTSYHPQANGILERFHRQLKASLRARLKNSENWVDKLPVVLLGIRSTPKDELKCSPAELVYGTTLRLPGEFFTNSSTSPTTAGSQADYLVQLRESIKKLQPTQPTWHTSKKTFIPKELQSNTHVFVRRDALRPSLSNPYEGPFKVLKRSGKYYTIDLNGRHDNVSIDRLKPAFLDDTSTQHTTPLVHSPTPAPTSAATLAPTLTINPPVLQKTRYGRTSRPPPSRFPGLVGEYVA